MYAVILAGGGGTRLHPLSRPDRPKPFLPLVDERTLLQHTVARLRGGPTDRLTDDITVVAAAGFRDLVAAQVPEAAVLAEPSGRNTAAAIALATLAIDRPDDDVMLVVPADQSIRDEAAYRRILRAAAEHLATGAFGVESPLVTLGIRVDRPATEYGYLIPDVSRGDDVGGLAAFPLLRFEEKPKPARAQELLEAPGVAWNAGIFVWRRRAIREALGRYTGLVQSIGPMLGSPASLARAYEAIVAPRSIDVAVMESAARDRRVVMGTMDVGWSDLGSWTQLLVAIGARGNGVVVQPGETIEVGGDDLVVRRVGGRLGVIAPIERGSMTATQPIAVLRGTGPDRALVERLIERCARGED